MVVRAEPPVLVILSATGPMALLFSAPAWMWMARATALGLALWLWVVGWSFSEGYCASGLVIVTEGPASASSWTRS